MKITHAKDQGRAFQTERRTGYLKVDQVRGAEMFRMAGGKRKRGIGASGKDDIKNLLDFSK